MESAVAAEFLNGEGILDAVTNAVKTNITMTLNEAIHANLIARETGKVNELRVATLQMMIFPELTAAEGGRRRPISLGDAIISGLVLAGARCSDTLATSQLMSLGRRWRGI